MIDQGQQQIFGAVDSKVRGLHMRAAQVENSVTSVDDICAAGHRVVFDFDSNNNDVCHAENKLTGVKTYFKLRNCVWELETTFIPMSETEKILALAEFGHVCLDVDEAMRP